MPPFPSEIAFGTLLRYSVRGQSELSRRSRDVRTAVKTDGFIGQTRVIEHAARRVAENIQEHGCLSQCLGPDVVLVPMPRSGLMQEGALWPAWVIGEALCQQGAGAVVLPCLRRVTPVRKAATAGQGERPGPADHCRTTHVDPIRSEQPRAITIIDDIVTRGSSFMGVIPHLMAAFPGVPIRCFAVIRTISQGEVATILDPVMGKITYINGQLHREP